MVKVYSHLAKWYKGLRPICESNFIPPLNGVCLGNYLVFELILCPQNYKAQLFEMAAMLFPCNGMAPYFAVLIHLNVFQ